MDSQFRAAERRWLQDPNEINLALLNLERHRSGLRYIIEEVIAGLGGDGRPARAYLYKLTATHFWYVSWVGDDNERHRSNLSDEVTARQIFETIKELLWLRCMTCDGQGSYWLDREARQVSCPCTFIEENMR